MVSCSGAIRSEVVFSSQLHGSHSNKPPKGICCTTTRFPSTSAYEFDVNQRNQNQNWLYKATYLIHLEQARIYFAPVRNTGGNGMQLRRMFMERTIFDFMDTHYGEEIKVCRGQRRMQDRWNGNRRLVFSRRLFDESRVTQQWSENLYLEVARCQRCMEENNNRLNPRHHDFQRVPICRHLEDANIIWDIARR